MHHAAAPYPFLPRPRRWRCTPTYAQISTVIRNVTERVRAKRAKLGDAFVDGLCKSFGSGIGMVPSEDSLALTVDNDVVVAYVVSAVGTLLQISLSASTVHCWHGFDEVCFPHWPLPAGPAMSSTCACR
jgi:hypothetical protein